PGLYQEFADAGERLAELYEKREFSRAMREIMALADQANRYIDEHKPWQALKDPARQAEVHGVCTQGLNFYRALMIYLKPVLPGIAESSEQFFNSDPWSWADVANPLLGEPLQPFKALIQRMDIKKVEKMLEKPAADEAAPVEDKNEINIDQFLNVELRIARIVKAEHVDGADKLLRLSLDLGDQQRTVFAGIRSAYDPADLENRLTVVVANLKPRKMRFGVSEGMVLAAGSGGDEIFLVSPDSGAKPGMRVR
ncbi:MAG: methionine--tRNA ligase subunit beta, partial [Gammaproteobacteria bacterium]|nr:methionine--tRNA ligase subunit beta [Gammaproteobacteria bacterium]